MLLGTRTEALPLRHSSAKASRTIVAEALAAWGLDLDVRAIQSCTSELVADALRHGSSPLHLIIQHWTDCVQVMVIDGGEQREGVRDLGSFESEARQRIVEGLATSWGVEPVRAGTAAWFDIETKPLAATLACWR